MEWPNLTTSLFSRHPRQRCFWRRLLHDILPNLQPISSLTWLATEIAPILRGWVTAIFPCFVRPDSCRNCGICVDFPLPVSATATRASFCSTARITCLLNPYTGNHEESMFYSQLSKKKAKQILHDAMSIADSSRLLLPGFASTLRKNNLLCINLICVNL